MRLKSSHIITTLVLVSVLFMSSCRQNNLTEEQFVKAIENIIKPDSQEYYDSEINQVFQLIKNNPQSIDYDLKDWPERVPQIKVCTSSDKRIRAYSFEKYGFEVPSLGINCRILIQYQERDGNVVCTEDYSGNGFIDDVFCVETGFYLFVYWNGSLINDSERVSIRYPHNFY